MTTADSKTTVTITDPLKTRLEAIRDSTPGLRSLNATIQHVLDNPIDGDIEMDADASMDKPVKVERYTLQRLQRMRDDSEFNNYEDLLRERVGGEARDRGEQPIEWEPLTD